ncbi:MAG: hypothetical protein AB7G23_11925 [Vicinamibacterales bacterium]
MRHHPLVRLAVLAVVLTGLAATAEAQNDGTRTILRLNTPARFYAPVRDLAAVRQMAANPRAQQGLTAVLGDAGLASLEPRIREILSAADPATLREVDFPVGGTMQWMAIRQRGGAPALMRTLRWGGQRPFRAYQFTVDDMNRTYTFILPVDCGNLALVSDEPSREAARVAAADAEARAAEATRQAEEQARATAAREEAQRAEAARQEQAAATEAARQAEANRTEAARQAEADRTEAARQAEADRTEAARQAGAQAPADTTPQQQARAAGQPATADGARQPGAAAQAGQDADAINDDARARLDWFAAGFFGKERRVRDDLVGGECAPLFGVKFGPDIRLTDTVRFAPAVGVAINTETGDHSSVFAEAEVRREFARGFIGGGAGVWDFNHTDTVAPSLLVDFGVLLNEAASGNRLYFTTEGRLFLDAADDIQNNYQFWGGIRYIWR